MSRGVLISLPLASRTAASQADAGSSVPVQIVGGARNEACDEAHPYYDEAEDEAI